MARVLELLLFGGAIGGAVYYFTRPSKAAVLPPGLPQPPTEAQKNQAEIQRLAAQVAAETQKQDAVKTQLANLSAAAAKAPPAAKAQLEAAKAQLAAAVAQGAGKAKALNAELAAKAQAEQAAKKAAEAKAVAGPLYPVGLDVFFGKRQATITTAQRDAQGVWQYTAYVKSGEPFGIGSRSYPFDEAALRQAMQSQVGTIEPGQFAVAGVRVYRNGQGGEILKAEKNATGEWTYVIKNWGSPVTQKELLGILTRT
jgi:hypothetical protein